MALGGAIGAVARYGVSRMWRNGSDASLMWRAGQAAFPWTTLVINAVGCFVMGVLTVVLKERFPAAPRLLSPLLTTGVLGGFTTFSSYTDDIRRLIDNDQPGYAVGYLFLTVAAAMAAVFLGVVLTRLVPSGRRADPSPAGGNR